MRGQRRKRRNLPERRPSIHCGYWRMRCCIIGVWVPLVTSARPCPASRGCAGSPRGWRNWRGRGESRGLLTIQIARRMLLQPLLVKVDMPCMSRTLDELAVHAKYLIFLGTKFGFRSSINSALSK